LCEAGKRVLLTVPGPQAPLDRPKILRPQDCTGDDYLFIFTQPLRLFERLFYILQREAVRQHFGQGILVFGPDQEVQCLQQDVRVVVDRGDDAGIAEVLERLTFLST
jgi:hypothetical protein